MIVTTYVLSDDRTNLLATEYKIKVLYENRISVQSILHLADKNNRGRVLKVKKRTGVVFEIINQSHTRK